MIEILRQELGNYYNEIVEVVTDYGIEWDDIYLQRDYSPDLDIFDDAYHSFVALKGGFIALDNLLNKLEEDGILHNI